MVAHLLYLLQHDIVAGYYCRMIDAQQYPELLLVVK